MEAKNLYESIMRGRWDEVVEAYAKNPETCKAKITKSGDTALHIAVASERIDIVLKLVEIIGGNTSKIKNKRGNTALHLAAGLGNVDLCRCIATKAPELLTARNIEGETPLFVAVLRGKKATFACLHFLSQEKHTSLCRKNNGDTILHSAISGEYFSLSYQIISYYPELVNFVNENGQSPLHILASKPNAFKSSSFLGLFDLIIYNCISVDELREEEHCQEAYSNDSGAKSSPNNSKNFESKSKAKSRANDEENPQNESRSQGLNLSKKEDKLFRSSCSIFVLVFKLMTKALLIILRLGIWRIRIIEEKKMKHRWANLVMNELVQLASMYNYEDKDGETFVVPAETTSVPDNDDISQSKNTNVGNSSIIASQNNNDYARDQSGTDKANLLAIKFGVNEMVDRILESNPYVTQEYLSTSPKNNLVLLTFEKEKTQQSDRNETPLLIAAKMGVTEIVEKILEKFPAAIEDVNSDKKNVVLLAAENRQKLVYELLLNRKTLMESTFQQVDNQGNNALHLAAMFGHHRASSLVPGAALQMQWEFKWYEFVKKSMPPNFFAQRNKRGRTPKEIFEDTHKHLIKDGSKWLAKTSESCSVIASLIATLAFSTSANVPGGSDQTSSKQLLQDHLAFKLYAISSLVAVCFSVSALLIFLAILTSRFQENNFAKDLPRNLLIGMTSVIISVVSILISYCSGHFLINAKLGSSAYPLYVATSLPVVYFALAQLPLYFDLLWANFRMVPRRS